MTDLDMGALTPHQRDVLGWIAIGQDGGHRPRTLAVLERLGYIVGDTQEVPGPFGAPMTVKRWTVPLAVHMQWAAWCAAHSEELDENQGAPF